MGHHLFGFDGHRVYRDEIEIEIAQTNFEALTPCLILTATPFPLS